MRDIKRFRMLVVGGQLLYPDGYEIAADGARKCGTQKSYVSVGRQP